MNIDELRTELRSLTKSSYHVYEKDRQRGYRRMSNLHCVYADGTTEQSRADDTDEAVLRQYQAAVRTARRIKEASE